MRLPCVIGLPTVTVVFTCDLHSRAMATIATPFHTTRFVRYALAWGFGLWLIGYVLGIIAFAFVPTSQIGWLIMPIGVLITSWVLLRVERESMWFYAGLSIVWTSFAISFDYLFIVRAFAPVDGYYKLDVYIYYFLTFALPLVFGIWSDTRQTARA